ncbi:hypothetical protein BHE74_00052655, partial [Ensete ventricosum]
RARSPFARPLSARNRHLMRLRSVVRGWPACDHRLKQLLPMRDRPNVLPGPSVA